VQQAKTPKASRPYMPGYGVPTSSKGMLAWSWAEERLKKSHNYWICTVRADGRPHVMVIWGVWLDGAFVFSTGRTSRKAKNLAERPECVVATERAEQAVIVEGIAEETRDVELRRRMLRLVEKKYKFDMSSFEEDILNLKEPIYVVRPATVFALDENNFPAGATRWSFAA
jgi:nitroimidazol reductase NimA-like FMN-containing flavoprotein (pyridoxamine 5'-phosphate oxidase superfamily)